MIGRLNHVAIAVPDIHEAANTYRNMLGAKVTEPQALPKQGVSTIFVELPNTKIEFIEPLGDDSPIKNFLAKNPKGGIHHICYEVKDIIAARDVLLEKGATITGTGEPSIGAHGTPVIFLHPKNFNGTLIELEEVA